MAGGRRRRRTCSPPTRRPRRASSAPAATPGGRGWSACCAGSASTRTSCRGPWQGFSGGELTRASLARSLVSRPDVLLLDEPTNHLDIDAVEWLERTIADLGATVILVSHDRWFLESVATGVLEIDRGRGRVWPMGYSAFRRERALAIDRQGAEAERQAAEIARLERFVTRWRAGTKARQAASRKKKLDRIERVEAPRRASPPGLRLPQERAQRARGDRGRRPRRRGARAGASSPAPGFTLERGQRLAIVGPNGAGKTTLIETLLGDRPAGARAASASATGSCPPTSPSRARSCDDRRTVVETVLAESDLTPTQARTLLGGFLFARRGGRGPGRAPVRRRAAAPVAGGPDRPRRQPAGARRADQPPRHREPRGARGRAGGVRRHRADGVARPRPDRRRRDPHAVAGGRRGA